jgi:hypothetical protein
VKNVLSIVVGSILVGSLILPCAAQTRSAANSKSSNNKKTEFAPPPSAQDIANAKSQGLVWVNLKTRVYHKGGDLYGKTKHGKFMNEDDAKEGFREATEAAGSKKSTRKTPADQSGVDATINTHSSTPPKP